MRTSVGFFIMMLLTIAIVAHIGGGSQGEHLVNDARHHDVMVTNEAAYTPRLYDFSLGEVYYTLHEPIYIHGNENFTDENGVTAGTGTKDDPYIIEGWDITCEVHDGIVIRNVSVYFVIKNCSIHDGRTRKDGIVFYNVTHGAIEYNVITRNRNGVMFRMQFPGKENSSDNVIAHNSIAHNNNDGIHFEHTGWGWHRSNNISFNEIAGNERGIYLIMSALNVISYNNITGNTGYGIMLDMCMGGGEYNRVHHNNVINNKGDDGQVKEQGSPINYWNDSYPSGGNYWDDYHGIDICPRDGFGDIPYGIPGGLNKDYYPLMKPYGKSKNKAVSLVYRSQLETLIERIQLLARLLNL